MKTAVVVVAHDGLVSQVTGVGVMVNSFVEAFNEIKYRSNYLRHKDLELICLSPYLSKNSNDFNPKIKEITKNACETTGGRLISIPTFSDGTSQNSIWCGPPYLSCYTQWRGASLSAASYLQSLKEKYKEIILFSHDTIFASVRKYCSEISNLNMIWIPHSLGKVFEDEFSDTERIKIEESAIQSIVNSKRDFIGYIGKYFKDKLQKDYGVNPSILLPFINGLYKNSIRFALSSSEEKLKEYSIPSDKKIIFSWGRCVAQKGYDLLIPAYKEFIKKNKDFHLVLLIPTETSDKRYLDEINSLISSIPPDKVTPVYKFDESLPRSVLSHNNLKMVLFPSRFEGAPITVLESLAFAGKKTKIIYSPIPPLIEVLEKDPRTIKLSQISTEGILKSMNEALTKNVTAAYSIKKYNLVSNYAHGIDLFGRLKNER